MSNFQGYIILISKIWSIGWLGKKYDYLPRKNVNIRGKMWKKGGNGEIFTALEEKNLKKLKRGGGTSSTNLI